MMYTVLNVLGLILFLAFMSFSMAIRFKLTMYHELSKKAEDEGKPISVNINKVIRDTLRMK